MAATNVQARLDTISGQQLADEEAQWAASESARNAQQNVFEPAI